MEQEQIELDSDSAVTPVTDAASPAIPVVVGANPRPVFEIYQDINRACNECRRVGLVVNEKRLFGSGMMNKGQTMICSLTLDGKPNAIDCALARLINSLKTKAGDERTRLLGLSADWIEQHRGSADPLPGQ